MRNIAVITGSRADASPMMHVLYGLWNGERVNTTHIQTTGLWDTEKQVREQLEHFSPDLVVLLGDRYETMVCAGVAALLRIPIVHLAGGDDTQGAVDNVFRNAISQLATWHYPSHPKHAMRLIGMGIRNYRIIGYGAPAVDNLVNLLSFEECCEQLVHPLPRKFFLVAFHPETLSVLSPGEQVLHLIMALNEFPEETFLVVAPNQDLGGDVVAENLQRWRDTTPNVYYTKNFDQRLYSSLLQHCTALIGNSSSCVIEAPVLGTHSVNIGDRQKGRIRFPTVIDVPCESEAIASGIRRAVALRVSADYDVQPYKLLNDYGVPGTVGKDIAEKLKVILHAS